MVYFVFMVDLKDSKKMGEEERRSCQARLKEAKNAVNRYAAGRARAEFSSGDSLQGYTDDPALALRVCLLILFLMYPVPVHCGVGCGEIYVFDSEEGTNANDGPAYHDALAAIERSKREGREIVARFGASADGLIDRLLASAEVIRDRNTAMQNQYAALYCLMHLSESDNTILDAGLPGYDYVKYDMFSPKGDDETLIEYISRVFGTSAKNAYNMLKKSRAAFLCGIYGSCLEYLSSEKREG